MLDLVPLAPVALMQPMLDVLGELAPRSRATYLLDMRYFLTWMQQRGLAVEQLSRSHMIEYRGELATAFKKATAARMLSVARTLLEAYADSAGVPNPAAKLKPFKLANETPHTALTRREARDLLRQIDRSRLKGSRDYALISLLLRTGIRRSECAALTIGDIGLLQGHHVAIIQHGKGDKRRTVKIPVHVFLSIEEYVQLARRQNHPPSAPLFVGVTRGGNATEVGVSEKLIERIVKDYGVRIGVVTLTPHGLRATFITLALEGGAKLEQVQYAAGHADPRTTERYQKRKTNLDDNAVDYVHIEA